jgi:hypothetical protein
MMENFAVVGLAPDMEIMDLIQIAEDLCGAWEDRNSQA